jgi:hypothetical protein
MEQTCKTRLSENLKGRIEDLKTLWASYCKGEETTEELGSLCEYGLCFDYVAPEGHKRGYFRYQLSWGGPSDEFRIFAEGSGYRWVVDKIEYWFLDWFDGASRKLTGKNLELIDEIFQNLFVEVGSVDSEHNKAMEDF